jgi:hypothetical protein
MVTVRPELEEAEEKVGTVDNEVVVRETVNVEVSSIEGARSEEEGEPNGFRTRRSSNENCNFAALEAVEVVPTISTFHSDSSGRGQSYLYSLLPLHPFSILPRSDFCFSRP